MAAVAGLIGLSLCLLSPVPNLLIFWLGWTLTGLAGAMFLTTSAYAHIAEYTEDRARSLIGILMLMTGLAGNVFWPITAFLDHLVSWRGTVPLLAGVMVLIVCPLVSFCLPTTGTATVSATHQARRRGAVVFVF
jgi:MFS family permease